MRRSGWIGLLPAAGLAVAASPAAATTYCVGFERPGCETRDRGAGLQRRQGRRRPDRSDADSGAIRVEFRGPAGGPLRAAELDTPAAAERANATTLSPRSRTVAVPPLARTIEVTLQSHRATGAYSDTYFDNVALTLAAAWPGAPCAGATGCG